ncbi:hypothetical protein EJB05_08399, partial [Eragrostis curvula]
MSAATKRPRERTASTCTAAETARVTHKFKIVGSILHKDFGVGNGIRSATFSMGGHDWSIIYYPDGRALDCKDYVAIYLELMSKNTETTTVHYDFRLVNLATGLSSSVLRRQTVYKPGITSWGTKKLMKKSDLETLGYLREDCLEIECDVTIIKVDKDDVPPSGLLDDLGKLLVWEEGKDVTFKVQEEVFRAHKIVLAMRSPVFKAQLYGPMSDKRKRSITVEDMQPPVFKALLHFIYKDSLPSMDNLDAHENEDMARHLLVAADRYAMERMKLMCESILCKRLDVENVATTLALADQYHCSKLKDVCIRFINSSNRLDDVVASKGYEHLKRACPALTVEIWEKSSKPRKRTLLVLLLASPPLPQFPYAKTPPAIMASAPERPRMRTASTRTAQTVRITHPFEIAGYSGHKGLGVGRYVSSGIFSVDGNDWRIRYYPSGSCAATKDYVAVFLNFCKGVGDKAETPGDVRLQAAQPGDRAVIVRVFFCSADKRY